MHKINKQSYMDAGLSLDERLSRNKHYRGKIKDEWNWLKKYELKKCCLWYYERLEIQKLL